MRSLILLTSIAVGTVALVGCDAPEPCDRYIDYMCACHSEEACSDAEDTLAGADPDVQDQCAIDLDAQQAADDQDGLTCDDAPTDG
jgi:hypothetical protein